MRAAPNYTPGEAVDGKWKQELLTYLCKQFKLVTLIETGGCDGGTLGAVYENFLTCHTIELSDYYYRILKDKFKDIKSIEVIHGNSAEKLRELLIKRNKMLADALYIPYSGEGVLFWLDAHVSGPMTANEGDPLPEEIKAIIALSPDSLIVIDDQQNGDLAQVKEAGVDLSDWTIEFRTGIVFLYKKGLYNIPEFE